MNKVISNIVFTRNRPLQLEGYIESLHRYFPAKLFQTYVLYKVELFEEEYELLFRKYPDCVVIKEEDFHSDLLKLLSQINTKYILFGVDDVVYFDSVDFEVIDETFNRFPEDTFGFSLRFSKESIESGNDPVSEAVVAGQTVYRIDWTQGHTPTTRYPFELCATIYPTGLVKKVINNEMNNNLLIKRFFSPGSVLMKVLGQSKLRRRILKRFGYFFSPNTFESWNCRWCQNNSHQLTWFLFFQKFCASAIQVNTVNTSILNISKGTNEKTVEALNDRYKQGDRLDLDFVKNNKPTGTHCGKEKFKLINKQQQKEL